MRTDTDVNSKVQNSCNKYEFFTALFPSCFRQTSLSLSFKLRDGKVKKRVQRHQDDDEKTTLLFKNLSYLCLF